MSDERKSLVDTPERTPQVARRLGGQAGALAEAEGPYATPLGIEKAGPQPTALAGGLRRSARGQRAGLLSRLQQQHGNAFVQQVVARYEAGEHAQFGSGTSVTVNGVPMTQGDLIAMGDLYETADDMKTAPKAELTALVDLIHRDRDWFEKHQGKRVTDDDWEQATAGRVKLKKKTYLQLAQANDTHFAAPAHGGPSGGDNKTEWEKYHRQALDAAHANAGASGSVPPEAIVLNGFAAHFLTDAFSAGHLVAKGDVMAEARKDWAKTPSTGTFFKESAFTKGVAKAVLADPKAGPPLKARELKLADWGDVTEERFSELLYFLSGSDTVLNKLADGADPDAFFNVFAKLVHDALNRSIGGGAAAGVEVTNAKGEPPWLLSGDTTLGASATTLRVARAAVDQSSQNLEDAAKTSGPLNYDDYFKKVWNYTPHPTATGQSHLQSLIATYADPTKPETIAAFAQLTADNIKTAISELEARKKMRLKAAPASPGGAGGGGAGGSSSDSAGGLPADAGVPGGVSPADARERDDSGS
jgi:hypothetical protein